MNLNGERMNGKRIWSVAGCVSLLAAGSVGAQDGSGQSPNADSGDGAVPTIAVPVAADPLPAGDDKPRSSSRLVEEVVVTAQKREEKLQDVPISVAAFSAEQLQAMGVDNTKDLGKVTPGLQFSEFAGFTLVYLRGVGTDSFLPYADPSVATYVDGLYIPAQQGLVNSFGGVERVEVLKGPQGTLFGRNSTGGAINVITKSPGRGTEVSAQAELGNLGTRKAQVYASTPVSDTVAASLSAIYNHVDPYYRQITSDLGPTDLPPADSLHPDVSSGARIKLRWFPIDELDFTLTGYQIRQQGSGSTIGALKQPSLLATALGIRAEQNDYEIHRNEPTLLKVENSVIAGNAVWNLPWFDLKLISGYQDIQTKDAYYDFDNSAKDLVSFFSHNAYSKVTTAEFQIASNGGSWMADSLRWIGGLYYLHSLGGYDPITLEVAGSGTPVLSGLGLLTPEQAAQVLERLPLLGNIPGVTLAPGVGVRVNIHGVLRTNSYSAFLQGDYDVADWLNVTVGGRGQIEDRFLTRQDVTLPTQNGDEMLLLDYDKPKVTQRNFTPKLSFNFKPADQKLIYLSWSKGYKSGTYNGINIYTPPNYVQPEIVNAYELGVKSEFFGRNLRFNAAVFQNDVKNMQVTFVSLVNGGAITFENAGSARIRGAEFDSLLIPFPNADSGLVVTGGVSFLDSIFTDYRNASGFNENTGFFFNKSGDFTGNRIPRSPKWSGNVAVNQTLPLGNGSLELAADVYYNGGFFYTAQNTDVARQDAYYLLNAHAGYLYDPWKLRVTLFGQNLNNRVYSYAEFTADFGTNVTLAPPRTYGVRLNWDF